ncbi:MAG: CBS domain-containing protein [Archangium sp.]|nr:CBS domain-containing protein [Archangium sp.]MDP3154594.1 CBS domain-containing protein [Archangium sp.]MDP3574344.1 CBS domain-containing protein [Archangium sp.]
MKLIREVFEAKSLKELITVSPDAPVVEAARLMALWSVGALLVLQNDQLVGLVSERDYVRAVAVGEPMEGRRVEDIMVREVRLVPADLTTDECMMLMTHLRLRHVPVTDGRDVLGIISLGDLVKDVVSEQAFVIEQLELYIRRAANA